MRETTKPTRDAAALLTELLATNPQINQDQLERSMDLALTLKNLGVGRRRFSLAAPDSLWRARIADENRSPI